MIVLLDENEVAREKAQVGERLETVFTDQRAARNPQLWSAVSLRAAKVVRDVENRHAAKALIAWGDTSSGFAAHLDDSQVEALKSDPRVAAVFPDAIGYPAATDPAPWLNRPGFGPGYSFTYGWNLYAIGAINYFTDATPALNSPSYRTTGGYPVKAYVIDSGIQPHADLNFNWQVDHISFDAHANVDGVCNPDSNGVCQTTPTYSYLSACDSHGTHVAGIIGAIRQAGTPAGVEGVAPGASVVSVRVNNYCQHRLEDQQNPIDPKSPLDFPGLTYLSTVLSAIDWVKAKSVAAGGSSLRTGAVANISILWDQGALTPTARTGLQTTITQAVNAGVFFAFAGGNSNQSACDLWPAKLGSSIAGAMTVGAMNNSGLPMHGIPGDPGKIASYGPCVEIWAPGPVRAEHRRLRWDGTGHPLPCCARRLVAGHARQSQLIERQRRTALLLPDIRIIDGCPPRGGRSTAGSEEVPASRPAFARPFSARGLHQHALTTEGDGQLRRQSRSSWRLDVARQDAPSQLLLRTTPCANS